MLMVKTLEYIIGPNGQKKIETTFSRVQSKGLQRVRHYWVTEHTQTHTHTQTTILMYVHLIFLKPMLYLYESIYVLPSYIFCMFMACIYIQLHGKK